MKEITKFFLLVSFAMLPTASFSDDVSAKGGITAKIANDGAAKKDSDAAEKIARASKTQDPDEKKELLRQAAEDTKQAQEMQNAGKACENSGNAAKQEDSPMPPPSTPPKKEDNKQDAKVETKAPEEKPVVKASEDTEANKAAQAQQKNLIDQYNKLSKAPLQAEPARAAVQTADPQIKDTSAAVVQANRLPERPVSFAEPVVPKAQLVSNAEKIKALGIGLPR